MLDKEGIMYFYGIILVLTVITTSSCSAIPKPDEQKKRVIDKELSDLDHNLDGDHNNDYDHEAFLGREDSKTFDQLTPEESLDGLSKIVDKIDKDGDGVVTEEELKNWIQYVQHRYIKTDTDRLWKDHEVQDDTLHWEAYKKRTYGVTDEQSDSYKSYKDMIERDLKRWQKADRDHDNILSKSEFTDFLHPEEAEHMQDIVVEETLADIDKDSDGFISLEEYIGDMYPNAESSEEPEWVKNERDMFNKYRDTDGDGKMDPAEVKKWLIPPDYDHSLAETKHLIFESDSDKDGKLTKDEILAKHDLFVGSQATDFGDALTRHDEF